LAPVEGWPSRPTAFGIPSAEGPLPKEASGLFGFSMSIGPRTRSAKPLAHATKRASFAGIAVEPGDPAAGTKGPAINSLAEQASKPEMATSVFTKRGN
jgi:hypothetical protein